MTKFQQALTHTLTRDEEVKAYLHPRRRRIIELLRDQKRTVTQVARLLGVHQANLTHHFKRLEQTGLIRLVEKRDTGRNIEKYYRSVSRSFDVLPPEGEVTHANASVLKFLRDDLTNSIAQLKGDDSETVLGLVTAARVSEVDQSEFIEKLKGLIEEFLSRDGGGDQLVTLNLSLYPRKSDFGSAGKIEIRKKRRNLQ